MNTEALRMTHSTNAAALRLLDLLRHYAGNEDTVDWEGFTEVETQLRALLSAQEPTGWRPIETAPRGDVLLYFPPDTGRNSKPEMFRVDFYPVCYPRQPTHWQPISAPQRELAKQDAK